MRIRSKVSKDIFRTFNAFVFKPWFFAKLAVLYLLIFAWKIKKYVVTLHPLTSKKHV